MARQALVRLQHVYVGDGCAACVPNNGGQGPILGHSPHTAARNRDCRQLIKCIKLALNFIYYRCQHVIRSYVTIYFGGCLGSAPWPRCGTMGVCEDPTLMVIAQGCCPCRYLEWGETVVPVAHCDAIRVWWEGVVAVYMRVARPLVFIR